MPTTRDFIGRDGFFSLRNHLQQVFLFFSPFDWIDNKRGPDLSTESFGILGTLKQLETRDLQNQWASLCASVIPLASLCFLEPHTAQGQVSWEALC